ncbi:MAG: fibronectin type III domain-containing protein, partial [Planctomycetes bacterium]|nr:fibronectin type III domain-containing protein [Planctomycetota bacterium]
TTTVYQFKLAAVNANGTGLFSTASGTVTPYGPPAAPIITSIVGGHTQCTIYITYPGTNGATITTINYSYSVNGGSWSNFVNLGNNSAVGSYTFSGLGVGWNYSVMIQAVNSAGASTNSNAMSVIINAPGAPTALTATSTGLGTASIAFTPGPLNGYQTSNMVYQYSSDSGTTWSSIITRSPASISSPLAITGLVASTSYIFKLAAINAMGTGQFSASTNSITSPIDSPPSAPTITSVTAGSGQVSVAFTAGSNSGSAITNYKYSTNGGSSYTSAGTTVSPIVISGLTNGTAYTVIMKAVNAAGDSVASTASSSVTPYTTPAAPTITSVSAGSGSGQVSVAFTAGSSNGSAITNYKYSTNGGSSYTSAGTTASPIVISGLTNGTAYTVIMKAVNAAGDSAASTASASVTPYTNPAAPTITSVTAGATNGSAITDYKYSTNGGSSYT